MRLIEPTAGVIHFEGQNVADLKNKDLKEFRRRAQMVFQDPFASLNPRMTVGDIVGEPLLVHGIGTAADRPDRVAEVLDKVGLEPGCFHPGPDYQPAGQTAGRIAVVLSIYLSRSGGGRAHSRPGGHHVSGQNC